jgi:hypothetical protein
MLAAIYASERGLSITAHVPDFVRFPGDADERRGALLVCEPEAANDSRSLRSLFPLALADQ